MRGGGKPRRRLVGRFRRVGTEHRLHVVATFLETAEPKPFNAALLIDPGGRSVLHHRKVHICDFDSPEIACGRGTGFAASDIETGAGRVTVGLMICSNRRDAHHAAMAPFPAQPPQEPALQQLGVEPSVFARRCSRDTATLEGGLRALDPTPLQPARQPEAVAAGFEGECDPRDVLPALTDCLAPAMQQGKQPFRARFLLLCAVDAQCREARRQPASSPGSARRRQ